MDIYSVLVAIMAAVLSGMGTAIVSSFKDAKKEKIRRQEKEQDQLRLDI
jgi:Na+-transporting methylmalonyl-CoA/oxaloacetate decarboxylase gamma subunit